MQPETKIQASQYTAAVNLLQKFPVQAAQLMIYPFLLILRVFIVRNRLYRDPASLDLKQKGTPTTYILYANHQSKLDPLIICASLPFRTLKQLLPFRFFVHNPYFKGPLGIFLNIMGGFPAHYEAARPYGLERARSLMASGQTIFIFPPGIRTRERIAKTGISVLATEANAHLIPVHIDWKHRWHCHVHIGKPLRSGVALPAERLMRYVYELPGQN